MKILHIITGLLQGGAEAMLSKLVTSPGSCRHIVVSLEEEGVYGPLLADAGVDVVALRLNRPLGVAIGAMRLHRIIQSVRPDIIQGWMMHGNLVAAASRLFSGTSIPVLWNVRGSLANMRGEPWLTQKIIRLNSRLSHIPHQILYNSDSCAIEHEAIGFATDKRRVIPNGFDLDRFASSAERRGRVRDTLGVGEDEVLVGLIARFHPIKNHAAFFEAASRILDVEPNTRFLLAGVGLSPENPDVQSLIRDPRMHERALLLGSRSDIPDLTCALDIACNVSIGEAFPNTVGEAMACGVPCVVTAVGESPRIVADTGYVCEGIESGAIAAAVLRMIANGPQGRSRLGKKAAARVASEFSLPAVVAQYEATYQRVLMGISNADDPQ